MPAAKDNTPTKFSSYSSSSSTAQKDKTPLTTAVGVKDGLVSGATKTSRDNDDRNTSDNIAVTVLPEGNHPPRGEY